MNDFEIAGILAESRIHRGGLTLLFIGHRLAEKLPVRPVHIVAALIFAALGVVTLVSGGAVLQ